jgi:hypothetical protein
VYRTRIPKTRSNAESLAAFSSSTPVGDGCHAQTLRCRARSAIMGRFKKPKARALPSGCRLPKCGPFCVLVLLPTFALALVTLLSVLFLRADGPAATGVANANAFRGDGGRGGSVSQIASGTASATANQQQVVAFAPGVTWDRSWQGCAAVYFWGGHKSGSTALARLLTANGNNAFVGAAEEICWAKCVRERETVLACVCTSLRADISASASLPFHFSS